MSLHKNRVKMTVSGTPGTGTITLSAASSGYQSFATAYGANATVDILITEGTAWEVARDCTYTNSGTTVTRGTLEASSTGSAVSFTSAAVVSVILSAGAGQQVALNQVTGTDADTTMAPGTLYVVDMSAWATADRTYTLPATAAVGDRCAVMVTAGGASHELILTAGSGDTLNGIAGGTEWSRVFITGEVVVMRCVGANATWVVEQDGRIFPTVLVGSDAATTQTFTRNSGVKVTTALTTENSDVGAEWDHANKKFVARRAGVYVINAFCQLSVLQDAKGMQVQLAKNTVMFSFGPVTYALVAGSPGAQLSAAIPLAVGDEIEMYLYHEDASTNRASLAGINRVFIDVQMRGNS